MRLTVRDLAAERGGRAIFSGLDFSLDAGGLLTVTGPNGAGKSTLLRVLAGFLTPVSGSAALDPTGEAGLSGSTHYLGHLNAVKGALTVAENLALWQRLIGGKGEGLIAEMGLGGLDDVPAFHLSAGQRRRLAMARLKLGSRPLWLLDEPTAALDAKGEALIWSLVSAHRAGGGLVVAATHAPIPLDVTLRLELGGAA